MSRPPPAAVTRVEEYPPEGPALPPRALRRFGSYRLQVMGRTDVPVGRSQDGAQLLAVHGALWVFDLPGGALRRRLHLPIEAYKAAFPEPGVVLLAEHHAPFRLLEWRHPGDRLRELGRLPGQVLQLALAAAAGPLAALGRGGEVTLWGPAGPVTLQVAAGVGLAFHPDGRRLAVRCLEENRTQFDRLPSTARVALFELPEAAPRWVREATGDADGDFGFQADGTLRAPLGEDRLRLDPDTGATLGPAAGDPLAAPGPCLADFRAALPPEQGPVDLPGVALAISPDGERVATATAVWDLARGNVQALPAFPGRPWLVAFEADPGSLLRGGYLQRLRRLELGTGTEQVLDDLAAVTGSAAVVAPDGRWMAQPAKAAVNATRRTTRVEIRDLPGGARRTSIRYPHDYVRYLVPTPDSGFLLITGGHGKPILRHDLGRGTTETYPGPLPERLARLAASPGGELLALAPFLGEELEVREFSSGELVLRLPMDRGSSASAFSPDGRLLAQDGPGGQVRLYDLRTRRALTPLEGHLGPGVRFHFLPCSTRLLTHGRDGTMLLFDLTRLK